MYATIYINIFSHRHSDYYSINFFPKMQKCVKRAPSISRVFAPPPYLPCVVGSSRESALRLLNPFPVSEAFKAVCSVHFSGGYQLIACTSDHSTMISMKIGRRKTELFGSLEQLHVKWYMERISPWFH
jgi:hypothetical protein